MDSNVAFALFYEPLESGLLARVEDVPGGHEEDDGVEARKALVGKDPGVLGRGDVPSELPSQLFDRANPIENGLVAVARRLAENEDREGEPGAYHAV